MSKGKRNEPKFWHDDPEVCIEVVRKAWIAGGKHGAMTRHWYYILLGPHLRIFKEHPNSAKNAYNWVCDLLADARCDGKLPWEAVIDEQRSRRWPSGYSNLDWYLDSFTWKTFVAPLDRGQPRKIAVVVEKEGLYEWVNQIVSPYRVVALVATGGFSSRTVAREIAKNLGNGYGWTVLYVGDFDADGLGIEVALQNRLKKFKCRPEIVRVAMTIEQRVECKPEAAQPFKEKSARAKLALELYPELREEIAAGIDPCYEVEALPPARVEALLRAEIEARLDMRALKDGKELEDYVDMRVNRHVERMLVAVTHELAPTLGSDYDDLRAVSLETRDLYARFGKRMVNTYLRPDDHSWQPGTVLRSEGSGYSLEREFETARRRVASAWALFHDGGLLDPNIPVENVCTLAEAWKDEARRLNESLTENGEDEEIDLEDADTAAYDAYYEANDDPGADPAHVERLHEIWLAL